jgi:hypothetical protein
MSDKSDSPETLLLLEALKTEEHFSFGELSGLESRGLGFTLIHRDCKERH